jgi:hypothetical protein
MTQDETISRIRVFEERLEVENAYVNGSTIQKKHRADCDWTDCESPEWDWSYIDYRVKEGTFVEPSERIQHVKETLKQIEVMESYAKRGKTIEQITRGNITGWKIVIGPRWNWENYKYRVFLEAPFRATEEDLKRVDTKRVLVKDKQTLEVMWIKESIVKETQDYWVLDRDNKQWENPNKRCTT